MAFGSCSSTAPMSLENLFSTRPGKKRFCDKVFKYRIFRPIVRMLSIQKRSEIVKNEHARYMLERFPTDNARVICTKKGIGKYGIMY
jgi:hypothetical protein